MQTSNPITLADIAKRVGVSVVTVSKVVNNSQGNTRCSEKTRLKIISCMEELHYQPNKLARQLAGKSSDIIGVVLDSRAPTSYHYLLAHMERYAAENGYRFLVGQAHDEPQKIVSFAQDFLAYRVAGFFCLAHGYPGWLTQIPAAYPENCTVFLEKPYGLKNGCYVTVNTRGAFAKITNEMLHAGRRRILFVEFIHPTAGEAMGQRRTGYLEALPAECKPLIKGITLEDMADCDRITEIFEPFVKTHKVDAIVAPNDYIACLIMKCMQSRGIRVPEQISISGYDNSEYSNLMTPSLTTFDEQLEEVAKAMIDLLMKLLKNPALPPEQRVKVIEPVLIRRESISPIIPSKKVGAKK